MRARVTVVQSSRRILIAIVRARSARGRASLGELACDADQRRLELRRSLTSRGKVTSLERDFAIRIGSTGLSSWKCARARSRRARRSPKRPASSSGGADLQLADRAQCRGRPRRSAVFGPTPWSVRHRVGGEVRHGLLAAHRDERGRLERGARGLGDQSRGPDADRQRHARCVRGPRRRARAGGRQRAPRRGRGRPRRCRSAGSTATRSRTISQTSRARAAGRPRSRARARPPAGTAPARAPPASPSRRRSGAPRSWRS